MQVLIILHPSSSISESIHRCSSKQLYHRMVIKYPLVEKKKKKRERRKNIIKSFQREKYCESERKAHTLRQFWHFTCSIVQVWILVSLAKVPKACEGFSSDGTQTERERERNTHTHTHTLCNTRTSPARVLMGGIFSLWHETYEIGYKK